MSALTGCPILPAAFNSDGKKILATWDNFIITYPFSRGVMVIGNPIYIHKKDISNKKKFKDKRREVEHALIEVTEEADEWFNNEKKIRIEYADIKKYDE